MNYFVGYQRSKYQYQNLSDIRTHTTLRSVLGVVILGLSLTLLVFTAWHFNKEQEDNVCVLYFNSRQSPIHVTSKKFLSFGLDSSLLRNMQHLPVFVERFIDLARHLSPAYVRLGGTSADCLYFNKTALGIYEGIAGSLNSNDITNFTINGGDLIRLYRFATKARLRMIFDLNVLLRNPDGSWDDGNAQDIIRFAKEHGMDLDWQLGNEPNSFHYVFNYTVNATELARDYRRLRRLLDKAGYSRSLLVGPEVNHVGDENHKGEWYAKEFLDASRNSVDYVTWHQYYLNGHIASLEDFLNVTTFDYLPSQIKSMIEITGLRDRNKSMWLSETSSAYGGGAANLSDTFVAGFLWLDKLGYSASAGLNVVTRQSFFGGYYALVGPDLEPNPDWWVSVIYKRFVSEKVLTLVTPNNSGKLRLYVHCTPKAALMGHPSGVTIYGMNIDSIPAHILIDGLLSMQDRPVQIFVYLLTSDQLQSREIKMNGETLKLCQNGDLPPFRPIVVEPMQIITLPPYSMLFMVVQADLVPSCLP
ncbi:hypothetical protein KM043_003244 [Ampulex compressa]|nr:hypothetical protein KM043_003244 [Ampulex compressa]